MQAAINHILLTNLKDESQNRSKCMRSCTSWKPPNTLSVGFLSTTFL